MALSQLQFGGFFGAEGTACMAAVSHSHTLYLTTTLRKGLGTLVYQTRECGYDVYVFITQNHMRAI